MAGKFELEDYYLETQLWALEPRIKPSLWLSNFQDNELPHANELLKSFFFFNDRLSKVILRHAFRRLSTYVTQGLADRQGAWDQFLKDTIITTVDIDQSNPTASGHLICRWARQFLGIPEEKIFNQIDSLDLLSSGNAKNVVFLDDFVGSGLQFANTWTIPVPCGTEMKSYVGLHNSKGIKGYYLPIIATTYGIYEIGKTCKEVNILPGNLLEDRDSVFNNESFIWSDELRPTAVHFVREASKRAGISSPQYMGFKKLGLTIGFGHAVPDATLPLFTWKQNGWKPLIDLH